MKIYTKTGDGGQTGLGDGTRVGKDDPRIQAYGTVDELNAALGVAAALCEAPLRSEINAIQRQLFAMGSVLANPKQCRALAQDSQADIAGLKDKSRLRDADVETLERLIDKHEATLKPLRAFILPGGTTAAAALHLARTICRRAERQLVSLGHKDPLPELYVIYLNRLSDLLFVMARAANAVSQVEDLPW